MNGTQSRFKCCQGCSIAAAIAALRRAGAVAAWQHTAWTSLDGEVLANPLEAPRATSRAFLLRAYRLQQMRNLCSRRKSFDGLQGGVDFQVTRRAFGKRWDESTVGALRAAMTGSAVTEDVACKWSGAGDRCPHCQWGREDLWHRWWECPAWASTRVRHMGLWSLAQLRAVLLRVTLLHGILPMGAKLLAARREAERHRDWPAPTGTPRTLCCVGLGGQSHGGKEVCGCT